MFGEVVDAYTMKESVQDNITVRIVYEGRAAKVTLNERKLQEIEAYYAQCAEEGSNEYQIEESKHALTNMEVILGDPDRLKAVASDFVLHYEQRIAEGASVLGKAMFVSAPTAASPTISIKKSSPCVRSGRKSGKAAKPPNSPPGRGKGCG